MQQVNFITVVFKTLHMASRLLNSFRLSFIILLFYEQNYGFFISFIRAIDDECIIFYMHVDGLGMTWMHEVFVKTINSSSVFRRCAMISTRISDDFLLFTVSMCIIHNSNKPLVTQDITE